MNRTKRVLINVLGPPLVAALLLSGFFIMAPGFILAVLLCAYLFATVPSVLHAAIMELIYARHAPPHSWRAVGCSTLSGVVCGVIIACVFSNPNHLRASDIGFFIPLGGAVGFLTGVAVKRFSRPRAKPAP